MQPKGFLSQTAGTAAPYWTGNDKGKTNAHGQKRLYTEGRFLSAISNGLSPIMSLVSQPYLSYCIRKYYSFTVTCLQHSFVYKFSIVKCLSYWGQRLCSHKCTLLTLFIPTIRELKQNQSHSLVLLEPEGIFNALTLHKRFEKSINICCL